MITKNSLLRTLTLSAAVLVALPAFSQDNPRRYGQGAAFGVDDLPPGQLRSRLENLPEQARAKALHWLSTLEFPEQDLDTLRIDDQGGVFYVDPLPTDPVDSGSSSTFAPAEIDATEVFLLHSRPGAPHTIYLDFDGEEITGTAWNGSVGTYYALPFDIDGNAANLSADEIADIHEVWQRIAEDYAPFNVDVTTQRPTTMGPNTGHVLITESYDAYNTPMPSSGAGGVAYVGPYGFSNYQYYSPALVYFDNLGSGYPPYISEAASHEMGHNIGLSHDGTTTGASYYSGHGSNLVSWGPIMGTGYNRNVSQWSKGEYPNANNSQDDIALITTDFGLSSDDHSASFTSASPLLISAGNVTATNPESDPGNSAPDNKGIIESRSDVDTFYFASGAGTLNLQVTPAWAAFTRSNNRGANLDIRAALYDANGNLIAEAANQDQTDALINHAVNAGTYYLSISGDGSTSSPYSDYGSQGTYFISGTVPSAVDDTTPPSPGTMSFAAAPSADDHTRISMTAVTATDDLGGPVQYYFDCVSGGSNCTDSGWQSSASFTAINLAEQTEYRWRVQARDSSGNANGWSETLAATTKAAPVAPPAPTNVAALDQQNGSALISWDAPVNENVSFEIVRESQHPKNGRWQSATVIASPAPGERQYLDQSGTGTFRYQVRALNGSLSSDFSLSNEVTVTDSSGGGSGGGSGGDGGCKGGPKKCG